MVCCISAIPSCVVVFVVFSVPLFYHMSASAQRLLLSFIYVHREEIPPSAFMSFVDALSTAVSILPTTEWMKVLLDLMKIFCSDKKCSSGSVCMATRKELEWGDLPNMYRQNSDSSENISSKLTADNAPAALSVSKDDVLTSHNSSLGFKGQQQMETEVGSEFPDMETDTIEEFPHVSSITATQPAKANDFGKIQTGMHTFYSGASHPQQQRHYSPSVPCFSPFCIPFSSPLPFSSFDVCRYSSFQRAIRSQPTRRQMTRRVDINNNNNNNNTLIYIAPACRMTSEALADSSSRATECLTEK